MLTCSLRKEIVEIFGAYKDFNFVKFFNMICYVEHIMQFGMTDVSSTSFKERANKMTKAAARRSNYHPQTVTMQVMRCLLLTAIHLKWCPRLDVQVANRVSEYEGAATVAASFIKSGLPGHAAGMSSLSCRPAS